MPQLVALSNGYKLRINPKQHKVTHHYGIALTLAIYSITRKVTVYGTANKTLWVELHKATLQMPPYLV